MLKQMNMQELGKPVHIKHTDIVKRIFAKILQKELSYVVFVVQIFCLHSKQKSPLLQYISFSKRESSSSMVKIGLSVPQFYTMYLQPQHSI